MFPQYSGGGGAQSSTGCKMNEINDEICYDMEILTETCGCNCEIVFRNYTVHRNTMGLKRDVNRVVLLFY